MNAKQFFDKVVVMREAQKDYFRTRSHSALQKSKALESEIDREIQRVQAIVGEQPSPQPVQPSLFADNINQP